MQGCCMLEDGQRNSGFREGAKQFQNMLNNQKAIQPQKK
jgi:hypothetical protein